MIWDLRNEYIFKIVADTCMKQHENSMETHIVYVEMFSM